MEGNVLGPAYRGGVIRSDGAKIETDIATASGVSRISTLVPTPLNAAWRSWTPPASRPRSRSRTTWASAAKGWRRRARIGPCSTPAPKCTTTTAPKCRRSRATGSSRWPSCPSGASTPRVREARARTRSDAGCEHHFRPLRPRGPDLADHVWDPLWSTCVELELPVHFHIGNSDSRMDLYDNYSWGSNPDSVKWAIRGMMLFIGNARSIVNLIGSGCSSVIPSSGSSQSRVASGGSRS